MSSAFSLDGITEANAVSSHKKCIGAKGTAVSSHIIYVGAKVKLPPKFFLAPDKVLFCDPKCIDIFLISL